MGELNEIALLCFWIIKLTPFHHPALASDVLNPKIALTLFTNTVMAYSAAKGKKKIPTSDFISDLYYSFRYRDLSKEAIMMMAEIFVQ